MKILIAIVSVALNLVLFGALLQLSRETADTEIRQASVLRVEEVQEPVATIPLSESGLAVPPSFEWERIYSNDFEIYTRNLRSVGCPEPTVRDIVSAEIDQQFAQRRQELFRPSQALFWENAAAGIHEGSQLAEELHALRQEKELLLKKLFGELEKKEAIVNSKYGSVLADILPSEKNEEMQKLSAAFTERRNQIQSSDQPSGEKNGLLQALEAEFSREQKALLSAEELEEFNLRQSNISGRLKAIAGFQANEDELRTLARFKLDEKPKPDPNSPNYSSLLAEQEASQKKVDEQIKTFLCPERFEQLQRAQEDGYALLYQVARRYELPMESINAAHDFSKVVRDEAAAVRNNPNLSGEERALLLNAIQHRTELELEQRLGPKALMVYRDRGGEWIDAIGDLDAKN